MKTAAALSRRQLLRLSLGLPLALTLLGAASTVVNSAPSKVAVKAGKSTLTPAELAAEWAGDAELDGQSVRARPGRTALILSGKREAPLPFQAVGARYLKSGEGELHLWLRSSVDGLSWTEWYLCGLENLAPAVDGLTHSTLYTTPAGDLHRYVQCRLTLMGKEGGKELALSSFGLDFMDASEGPRAGEPMVPAAEVSVVADKPGVVSRTSWGCSDGQNSPGWTPEYFTASHVIIHHTATTNTPADWYAQVRNIWYYHSVTLGWGDVGYNFLVAANGNIFEGRAGANASGHADDDVEAGHCYSYNRHTVGLAIMGDYRYTAPTSAALNAAERLMAWKFGQRSLNPKDTAGIERGCDAATVNMPRIAGHTDYGSAGWGSNVCPGAPSPQTDCPGALLEAKMGELRDVTATLTPNQGVSLTNVSIGPVLVAVGARLTVAATITNTGNTTLYSGSPDSGYVYSEGSAAGSSAWGTIRLGLDYDGRDSNQIVYPYRWGIGGDLAPGASRTVQVAINVAKVSSRRYWVGLIREGVGLLADRVATTTIEARVKQGDICLANVAIRPPVVFAGNLLEFSAEVENWTGNTLLTQGQNPGYVYGESEVFPAETAGAYRIGLEYSGRSSTVKDHPYRWGLGGSQPPLTVRAVKGFVRLSTARGATDFWLGLVKENVAWVQDGVGRTSISVQNPASRLRLPSVYK